MKKILFILSVSIYTSLGCSDKITTITPAISESETCYVGVQKFVPDYSLARFESEVTNLEAVDIKKAYDKLQNSVIFIGSSTFTNWNATLSTDFSTLPVIGHGFGGSTFPELIYYKSRLVTKFNPKIVVVYCENDFFGTKSKSEAQVLADACYFFSDLHQLLPLAKIFIVSLKPSPVRRPFLSNIISINASLKAYTLTKPYLGYIDITPAMFKSDQKTIDGSIFTSDSLHMNKSGYERWKTIIKPILEVDYLRK
jgi:lysophospholipase L1-like esterase